jgi:hypothetical protein
MDWWDDPSIWDKAKPADSTKYVATQAAKGVSDIPGYIGDAILDPFRDLGDIPNQIKEILHGFMGGSTSEDVQNVRQRFKRPGVASGVINPEVDKVLPDTEAPGPISKHVGAAVRGAVSMAPFAVGGVAPALISGAGMGEGGQVASDLFPDSPIAPIIGEIVGGAAGGGVHEVAKGVRNGRLISTGMAHPDYDKLVNTVVSNEGGGTVEHPKTNPKTGARGQMQVMPDTAGSPGYGIRKSNGTAADDIRLGRQYLAAMLGKYGEPDKALAAYDWGPGHLDHAIKEYGENWFDHAPAETQKYVLDGMAKTYANGSTGRGVPPMDPVDIAEAMGDPEAAGLPRLEDSIDYENDPPIDENTEDASGLRAAIMDTDGNIHVGDKGDIHANVIRDMMAKGIPENKWADSGFVDESGNFLTKNEAGEKYGISDATLLPDIVGPDTDPVVRQQEVDALNPEGTPLPKEPVNDLSEADAADREGVYGYDLGDQEPPSGGGEEPPQEPPSGGGEEPPSGDEPPKSEGPTPEVFEKLTNALQDARKSRSVQNRLYSEERSRRAQAVGRVRQTTSGVQGFYQEKAQLRGELPTADYAGLNGITQEDVEALFNHVKNHPALGWLQSIRARTGLSKMLQGETPTAGEIQLLARVLPKDVMKEVLQSRSLLGKIADSTASILNVPKALMASFDLSAPLRQGVFFIGKAEFWKSWIPMVKAFASPKAAAAVKEAIYRNPLFPVMQDGGLEVPAYEGHNGGPDLLSTHEEPFQTRLAQKIPLVGIGVRASERAYNTFIYKLRADTFTSLYHAGKAAGKIWDQKSIEDLSRFINTFTGRGDLGKFNNAAPLLNAAFFSPRLLKSRLDAINILPGGFYHNLDPFVRKEAIKSILTFAATATTVLGLAKLAGAEVGADPRQADGWKIKIGNTRHDILGGEQQVIRLMTNIASWTYNKGTEVAKTGKIKAGGPFDKTAADATGQFFRNKESPDVSFFHDFYAGKTAVGDDFNIGKETISRFTPLFGQDVYAAADDLKKQGVPVDQAVVEGLASVPDGFFGTGVQTYRPHEKKAKKSKADKEFGFDDGFTKESGASDKEMEKWFNQ